MIKTKLLIFNAVFALFFFGAVSAENQAEAQNAKTRLMIVGIDGLKPSVLMQADAPNIKNQINTGSFSLAMRTTDVAITLPSFVSMVTGAPPDTHGVNWNDERYVASPRYSPVPTIFDLAKSAGLKVALISGKSKFVSLARPDSLDASFVPVSKKASDDDVALEAGKILSRKDLDLVFVHLADVDSIGHRIGWGTLEQIAAIKNADRLVGELLSQFRKTEHDYLIISADHGGLGRSHGKDTPESHLIPFIISGAGIKKNYEVPQSREPRIEDIFATACRILKLKPGEQVAGRVIEDIFE